MDEREEHSGEHERACADVAAEEALSPERVIEARLHVPTEERLFGERDEQEVREQKARGVLGERWRESTREAMEVHVREDERGERDEGDPERDRELTQRGHEALAKRADEAPFVGRAPPEQPPERDAVRGEPAAPLGPVDRGVQEGERDAERRDLGEAERVTRPRKRCADEGDETE